MEKDRLSTFRLNLNFQEFEILLENLNITNINEMIEYTKDSESSWNTLKEKLNNPIKIKHSQNKRKAMSKATNARSTKAKEKIDKAINKLQLENKKITHYSIAKTANTAFVTVKKYVDGNYLKSLNEIK